MNALFFTAIVMFLSAVALTIYAVVSAKDGVQDARGFHRVRREGGDPEDGADSESEGGNVPPFLSVH